MKNKSVGFGTFEVDLATGEIRKEGIKIKLQEKPFAVLALLLERPGELVTREEFRERIWGAGTFIDFDQGLNKAVRSIRAALDDSAEQPRYLETLPRRGYRFIASVESIQNSDTAKPLDSPAARIPRVARAVSRDGLAALSASILAVLGVVFLLSRYGIGVRPEFALEQITANKSENFIRNCVISPDGRYLLYGDAIGIHLRVLATGEVHNFERPKGLPEADSWYPTAWFPDQTHFLAVSESLTSYGVVPTSWIESVLGDATKLHEGIVALSVSPDGSRVAFTTGGFGHDQDIGVMGPNGEESLILNRGRAYKNVLSLAWSPDGGRLFDLTEQVVDSNSADIKNKFVLESRALAGGATIPLVSFQSEYSISPAQAGLYSFCFLSRSRLIYTRSFAARSPAGADDTNIWEIKIKPETGVPDGNPHQLTHWLGNHVNHISASRDGHSVVVQKSNWEMHTYIGELPNGAPARPLRRLTFEESDDLPYAWTPDSKAVLFLSNRTGEQRLYKQRIDAKVAELVNTGSGIVAEARVSPDGQWILYSTKASEGRPARVLRVPVLGAPLISL